jgi:hypothetical protein
MRSYLTAIGFSLAFVPSLACEARTGGGTTIGNSATVTATTGSETALAIGVGTSAINSTGVISDSRIGGEANASGNSRSQVAMALSIGARARTMVGTITGVDTPGSASASGLAGNVAAVTIMPGSSTCAAVGSVGPGGTRAVGAAGSIVAYNFGLFRHPRIRIGTSGAVC